MMGTGAIGSKAIRGIQATNATASDMAKEIRGSIIAGLSRTYSDERSREDKCGNSIP